MKLLTTMLSVWLIVALFFGWGLVALIPFVSMEEATKAALRYGSLWMLTTACLCLLGLIYLKLP